MPLAKIHPGLIIKASDLNTTIQPIEVEIEASFKLDNERIYVLPDYNGEVKITLFEAIKFIQSTVMVQNSAFHCSTKCMMLTKPEQLNFSFTETIEITFSTGFTASINDPAQKKPVNPNIAEKYRQKKCNDILMESKIITYLDPDIVPVKGSFDSGTKIIVDDKEYTITEKLKFLITSPFFIANDLLIAPKDVQPEPFEIRINVLRHCHFIKDTISTNPGQSQYHQLSLVDGMNIRMKSDTLVSFRNYLPWEITGDGDICKRRIYSEHSGWGIQVMTFDSVKRYSWINQDQMV